MLLWLDANKFSNLYEDEKFVKNHELPGSFKNKFKTWKTLYLLKKLRSWLKTF